MDILLADFVGLTPSGSSRSSRAPQGEPSVFACCTLPSTSKSKSSEAEPLSSLHRETFL